MGQTTSFADPGIETAAAKIVAQTIFALSFDVKRLGRGTGRYLPRRSYNLFEQSSTPPNFGEGTGRQAKYASES